MEDAVTPKTVPPTDAFVERVARAMYEQVHDGAWAEVRGRVGESIWLGRARNVIAELRSEEPMPKTDVPIGMEIIKLGDIDDKSPWRMTVDYWDGREQTIKRAQVTGHWGGWPEGNPVRTLAELTAVQADFSRAAEIAAALDRLDREYVAAIAPHVAHLRREQMRVIYGDEQVRELEQADE